MIQAVAPDVASMAPAEAISIARARLLHTKPFYGHLLASAEARHDPSLKAGLATTMDVLGRFVILYNPTRWTMPDTPRTTGEAPGAEGRRLRLCELSPEDRRSVLAKPRVPWTTVELAGGLEHECHHLLQMHHSRGAALEAGPWQLAADVAINQNLTDLPSFAIDHRTYHLEAGLSAEAYYVDLLDRPTDDEDDAKGSADGKVAEGRQDGDESTKTPRSGEDEDQDSDGGPDSHQDDREKSPSSGGEGSSAENDDAAPEGSPFDHHGVRDGAETTCDSSAWGAVADYPDRFERRVSAIAQEALQQCRAAGDGAGYLPAGLLERVQAAGRAKNRCREFLRRFGRSHAAIALRPTARRPNRRYGWDQPGFRVKGKAKFAVIIDTSGSVGRKHLAWFLAHLESWSAWAELVVIQIDGEVQSVQRHRRGTRDMEFRGRGGTVLDEAFELVAGRASRPIANRHLLRGVAAVLILTDGDLWSVPDENPMRLDVMWVLTPGAPKKASWGKHVHLEDSP